MRCNKWRVVVVCLIHSSSTEGSGLALVKFLFLAYYQCVQTLFEKFECDFLYSTSKLIFSPISVFFSCLHVLVSLRSSYMVLVYCCFQSWSHEVIESKLTPLLRLHAVSWCSCVMSACAALSSSFGRETFPEKKNRFLIFHTSPPFCRWQFILGIVLLQLVLVFIPLSDCFVLICGFSQKVSNKNSYC